MRRQSIAVAAAAIVAVAGLAVPEAALAAPGFDPTSAAARIAGADRYETAAKAALSAWGGTSGGTVIVANGETNGIDALTASYLAGVVDAPILLTRRDGVPDATATALRDLAPTRVIVIGGEPSVAPATFATLTANVSGQRIGGVDRYDTAARIAATARNLSGTTDRPQVAFLARGDVAADQVAANALAASPVAYAAHFPILLTAVDHLPDATASALASVAPHTLTVLGGDNAVSENTAFQAQQAAHVTIPRERLAGVDRSWTAALIAESSAAGFADLGRGTRVGFANGTTVDALAGGAAAGKVGYPILLALSRDDVGDGTRRWVADHEASLVVAHVFGDRQSLSDAALTPLRSPGATVAP